MIVLDASALVDVVLDQPAGGWVLEQLLTGPVCAPAHQPAEIVSAIARLVRAGEVEAEDARRAVGEAMALGHELVPLTRAHLDRALALQDRVRVLDGLYVALAEERGCALVTTDARLAGAGAPCEVRIP